jgi:hypothetical protein
MWHPVLRTVSLDVDVVTAQTYTRPPVGLDELADMPIADAVERFMSGSPGASVRANCHPANAANHSNWALPCSNMERISMLCPELCKSQRPDLFVCWGLGVVRHPLYVTTSAVLYVRWRDLFARLDARRVERYG